jgi:hypothetical protein
VTAVATDPGYVVAMSSKTDVEMAVVGPWRTSLMGPHLRWHLSIRSAACQSFLAVTEGFGIAVILEADPGCMLVRRHPHFWGMDPSSRLKTLNLSWGAE